ncbi:MAG: hypothetical protein MUC49_02165 [Raineya sp.]|jgi:hypothetical protein|nr:hypothetical protein [Raineya sp.]
MNRNVVLKRLIIVVFYNCFVVGLFLYIIFGLGESKLWLIAMVACIRLFENYSSESEYELQIKKILHREKYSLIEKIFQFKIDIANAKDTDKQNELKLQKALCEAAYDKIKDIDNQLLFPGSDKKEPTNLADYTITISKIKK